jgi:hypothetical protein
MQSEAGQNNFYSFLLSQHKLMLCIQRVKKSTQLAIRFVYFA